jgi:hypothetical protein
MPTTSLGRAGLVLCCANVLVTFVTKIDRRRKAIRFISIDLSLFVWNALQRKLNNVTYLFPDLFLLPTMPGAFVLIWAYGL